MSKPMTTHPETQPGTTDTCIPRRALEGKSIIVMGAGSIAPGWSNGKASALSYARAGAHVVCVDQVIARAEDAAHCLSGERGRVIALRADATQEQDVAGVVARAEREFGRLDVMHNNVGVGGSMGTPDQIPLAAWERELSVNLTSAYLGIRHAVPAMRRVGGGAIINISSLLAVRFLKQPSVGYSAAKAGVEALTRACAAAYGRDNIRVNCIRIGFAETPLVDLGMAVRGLSGERKEQEMNKSRAKVPLRGEHTDPFDVGATALFLASDAARHITGVVLGVDGGLECAPL
jgi:NAD(P)-dependent dehydrogenase (short-subunit alcohol dehydrogenase family)